MESVNQSGVRPKNAGSPKMFDNPILERLTRTPIWAPIALYIILAAGLLYWAISAEKLPVVLVVGLFFGGWLFFTLLEYLAHRYLFHIKPNTEFKKKLQYSLHGVHHEYPKDKDRLAMPLPSSIVLALVFFAVFYLLIQTYAYGFLPGVMVGYATYLLVHYLVHAYPPPNNFFKALWVNHSIHHYKDNTIIFGVSSPIWDYVFGTIQKKD